MSSCGEVWTTCSELTLTTASSTCFDTAAKPLLRSTSAGFPDVLSGWGGEGEPGAGPETRFRPVSNFISTSRAASANNKIPSPTPTFIFDGECIVISAFRLFDLASMVFTLFEIRCPLEVQPEGPTRPITQNPCQRT